MNLPAIKINNFFDESVLKTDTAKKNSKTTTAKKSIIPIATSRTTKRKRSPSITSSSINIQPDIQSDIQPDIQPLFKRVKTSIVNSVNNESYDLLTRLCPNLSYCTTFGSYNGLHLFSFKTPILYDKKIRKNIKSIVGISPTMVLLFPLPFYWKW